MQKIFADTEILLSLYTPNYLLYFFNPGLPKDWGLLFYIFQ
jgi:hypothetical protein